MPEFKRMEWDEAVWAALRASVTPMPPFVRKKALLKIIEASELNARQRSALRVETNDLIKAVLERVPQNIRAICLESLAEHGITE
jgi:hypothetical protein